MRLKIISDGTSYGTTVVDSETGKVVEGVRSIIWRCKAGGLTEAEIEFRRIEIDAEVTA